MVKISTIKRTGEVVTLQLEGRVVGPWVAEVRNSCDTLLAQTSGLVLDLTDVSFADSHGIALLQELRSRGITLVNCSAFLAGQIGNEKKESASC